jgi:hypothetical protein
MNTIALIWRRPREQPELLHKSQPAFWTWFIENPRLPNPPGNSLRALHMRGDFDLGRLREHVERGDGNHSELRA